MLVSYVVPALLWTAGRWVNGELAHEWEGAEFEGVGCVLGVEGFTSLDVGVKVGNHAVQRGC